MTNYDLGLVKGSDGVGITSITKTSSSGLEDTYTITYTNGDTTTFTVTNGAKGDKGDTGATGATGKGITSITKTGTSGKVDTYTITYSDNSTSTFTVTNGTDGNDGNGIQSIEKISTSGNADTYRIHFTDSTYYDYTVTNGANGNDGKGISSIVKTGTSGLVDTYTITYSDNTTSTFTVTNGKDGEDGSIVTFTQVLSSGTKLGTITIDGTSTDLYCNTGGGVDVGSFTDLQSIITSASSGDVITLDKDYKYDSSTDSSLTSGVVIDKNITIIGNGHIIDGNSSATAFTMTGASNNKLTINFEDIIIQKCTSTTNGGAINASTYCDINITDSLFTQNTSTGGGAIYAYSHCNLNITYSTFTHNSTDTGSNKFGGAILATNYCDVFIEESVFKYNTSNTRGGVLYGATNTNTTINNSILTGNTSSEGGALSFRNLGSSTKLQMNNTSVYGNTASSSANIYCNAGMTVYNCTLSDTASTYTNVTNYSDVSSENIVDDLTTNDATKVLSAKQGKALKDTLDTKISTSNTTGLVKNDGTIDTTSYSTFSGSYTDLSNKPSIPSSSSDLSDGSDIIKKSNTSGLIKNDGTIDTTSYVSDISGKADKTGGASQITDSTAHSNIGTSAGATQATINSAIDSKIGTAIAYINQ